MTLKELQNRIERTAGMDLPTAAWLRAGNSPLVVSRELEGGTKLSVYQNGFALYQTEGGSTVFRVDRCGGYIYFGRNEQTELSEDFFENTDWWVRLLIEGEDRLTHNRKVLSEKYEYFYESDPEIFNNICVAESSPQDALMTNELLEKAFSMMTERQRAVVTMYYIDGMGVQEIAAVYGISHQAVSVTLMNLKSLSFSSIINEKTKKLSLLIGVVFNASTGIVLLYLYWLIYLTVSR